MASTLTKRVVDRTGAVTGDQFIWDGELRGFGLKVTPAGKKVFVYQYRTGGRGTPTKRVTIGNYGPLTVNQARTRARRFAGDVSEGRDPRLEILQGQSLHRAQAKNTFAGLVADFVEHYAKPRQRTWQETERLLKHDAVAAWARRPVTTLTRPEVSALLHTVAERAPIVANRVMAALRKLFNWAVTTGRMDSSPLTGMSLISVERPRDRVLSDDELMRVLHAADGLGYPFGPFMLVLTLTAQRRDEVAGLRWSEIKGGQWTIPAGRTKNGRAHIVHLSPPALAVLSGIPGREDSDLVFTTTGTTPISGFSRAKDQLDTISGVKKWRFHDIRRTVTTELANLGHPPHICDKILNHSGGAISGVAAVYQKAEFLAGREKALDDWGRHISAMLDTGERKGNAA